MESSEQGTPMIDDSASASATENLQVRIEAALLTTDQPLAASKLSDAMDKVGIAAVKVAVDELNQLYEKTSRSFRIKRMANGYQIATLPEFADVLSGLHKSRQQTKLSPAALEALAIIAYKQPILRSDIEAVRGVASGEVIRGLMERNMVKIAGRAEELGRPMLYGTTKKFLEVFGLADLKDLPTVDQLKGGS